MPQIGKDEFVRIRMAGGTGSYILAPVLTTTQRDALTAEEGMVIFNSTTDQLEEYDGATWEAVGQVILDTHTADIDAHHSFMRELLRTGEYYAGVPFQTIGGSATVVADRLYAVPLLIPRALTIDYLAINVIVLGTASTVRVGLYNNGTNLYPGTRLNNGGIADTSATGVKTIAVAQAFTPGLYWIALISDVDPKLTTIRPTDPPIGIQASSLYAWHAGWYVADTYGNLPDPFPSGGTLLAAECVHALYKIASLD